MSNVVWKFKVDHGRNQFTFPGEARVRHFGMQWANWAHEEQYPPGSAEMYIWVEVDPDSIVRDYREFEFVGTGHPVPNDLPEFIGTAFAGQFVWHLYGSAAHQSDWKR